MSPIDNQLLVRKAKLIEADLTKLREFENISLNEYTQSLEIRLQVERLLERIVGRVIDVNYHILKEEFNSLPQDYYKSFTELGKKEVIDMELAEQLAESTGLRNALAHEYDAIDDAQVFKSINRCLSQVPQYLKTILDKYTA